MYKAKDLYFKGFIRMPLGRPRVELAKFVTTEHVIELSFNKESLRVAIRQESAAKMQTIMREHWFRETILNPLSTKLLNGHNLDDTTEEDKKAIARYFNLMHQEEV